MKIWLGKHGRGFLPTDDQSKKIHARMEPGEVAEFEITRIRSIQMHRMYFGICRQIGLNQDPQRDESSIDHELRILAGHYDVIRIGRRRMPWWFGPLARILEKNGRLGSWLVKRLRTRLGHAHEVYVPKRIAFAKLTHDEWMDLWPSIELAIRERFGDGYIQERERAA